MLNLFSILIGVLAFFFGIIAFIPLFGWAYWAIVPLALVGLLLGLMSNKTTGRNLNLVIVLLGVFRLFIGGGII